MHVPLRVVPLFRTPVPRASRKRRDSVGWTDRHTLAAAMSQQFARRHETAGTFPATSGLNLWTVVVPVLPADSGFRFPASACLPARHRRRDMANDCTLVIRPSPRLEKCRITIDVSSYCCFVDDLGCVEQKLAGTGGSHVLMPSGPEAPPAGPPLPCRLFAPSAARRAYDRLCDLWIGNSRSTDRQFSVNWSRGGTPDRTRR